MNALIPMWLWNKYCLGWFNPLTSVALSLFSTFDSNFSDSEAFF